MNRSRTCREKGDFKCATKGAAASRKAMNCLDRNVQTLDNAICLCNYIISQDKAGYVTYSFLLSIVLSKQKTYLLSNANLHGDSLTNFVNYQEIYSYIKP